MFFICVYVYVFYVIFKTGKVVADETEKGWYIQWIDRDPRLLAMQEAAARRERADLEDEEKQVIEPQPCLVSKTGGGKGRWREGIYVCLYLVCMKRSRETTCLTTTFFFCKGFTKKCRRLGGRFVFFTLFFVHILRFLLEGKSENKRFRCATRRHNQPASHAPTQAATPLQIMPDESRWVCLHNATQHERPLQINTKAQGGVYPTAERSCRCLAG